MNRSGIEIHGTMYREEGKEAGKIPSYVVNHGILGGEDLHMLLRRSKVSGGLVKGVTLLGTLDDCKIRLVCNGGLVFAMFTHR